MLHSIFKNLHVDLSIAFSKGQSDCQFIDLDLGKKIWDSKSLSSLRTSVCYVNLSKSA